MTNALFIASPLSLDDKLQLCRLYMAGASAKNMKDIFQLNSISNVFEIITELENLAKTI
jgi:hypothetical protein